MGKGTKGLPYRIKKILHKYAGKTIRQVCIKLKAELGEAEYKEYKDQISQYLKDQKRERCGVRPDLPFGSDEEIKEDQKSEDEDDNNLQCKEKLTKPIKKEKTSENLRLRNLHFKYYKEDNQEELKQNESHSTFKFLYMGETDPFQEMIDNYTFNNNIAERVRSQEDDYETDEQTLRRGKMITGSHVRVTGDALMHWTLLMDKLFMFEVDAVERYVRRVFAYAHECYIHPLDLLIKLELQRTLKYEPELWVKLRYFNATNYWQYQEHQEIRDIPIEGDALKREISIIIGAPRDIGDNSVLTWGDVLDSVRALEQKIITYSRYGIRGKAPLPSIVDHKIDKNTDFYPTHTHGDRLITRETYNLQNIPRYRAYRALRRDPQMRVQQYYQYARQLIVEAQEEMGDKMNPVDFDYELARAGAFRTHHWLFNDALPEDPIDRYMQFEDWDRKLRKDPPKTTVEESHQYDPQTGITHLVEHEYHASEDLNTYVDDGQMWEQTYGEGYQTDLEENEEKRLKKRKEEDEERDKQ